MAKLIEDELQDVLSRAPAGDDVFVLRTLLERAIKEIEHMRLSVGAVTSGESFDDIAKRQGRQPRSGD